MSGNVLIVQLRSSVLEDIHKILFHFLVEGEGEIPPLDVFVIIYIFSDIFSEDAFWLDTTVTHLEGRWKLSENAINVLTTKKEVYLDNPMNMDSVLRISLTRYNQTLFMVFVKISRTKKWLQVYFK